MIETKITSVFDADTKLVGPNKDKPMLKLKFELANGSKGTATLFLEQYGEEEIRALLKVLRFVGSADEFIQDNREDRIRGFKLDFSTSIFCTVEEREFRNEQGIKNPWNEVISIADVYKKKQLTQDRINKQQLVKSFSPLLKATQDSGGAGNSSAPF